MTAADTPPAADVPAPVSNVIGEPFTTVSVARLAALEAVAEAARQIDWVLILVKARDISTNVTGLIGIVTY